MITVDTIGRVRRAYFVQGRKIKAIARDLRLARNTVRDIVRAGPTGEATERRYVRDKQPLPRLGEFVPALETMLADNLKKPKRERLTFQRMFEELRLAGYRGGYDNVRRYARVWAIREGERTAAAFVPLSFAPGEAYQFDWRCGADRSFVESPEGISPPGAPRTVHDPLEFTRLPMFGRSHDIAANGRRASASSGEAGRTSPCRPWFGAPSACTCDGPT